MPENHLLSIKDLTIDNPKKSSDYFCQNFKIFPENKEKHGGFLFGIIEIRATDPNQAEKVYTTILNGLNESYYQQITSSPDPTKCHLETIFEFALNKTNQKIIELIQIGQINLILENLSYFIGIVKPNTDNTESQLYFTSKGQINAYVVHKTKKNDYKLVSIIDSAPQPNQTINNKVKIFSSITSGQLNFYDTIVIMTEIVHNLISPAKILHIISHNSLNEAIDYFKTQLKELHTKNFQSHCTIFLKHELALDNNPKSDSERSIASFINTTQTTEKLLTPSFALNITKHAKRALIFISKIFSLDPTTNKSGRTAISRTLNQLKSTILALLSFKKTGNVITTPKNVETRSFSIKNILSLTKKPKNGLYIITAIIMFGLLLSGGIFWSKYQKNVHAASATYKTQIESVKTLIADAESNYIYKNQDQSLVFITEAAAKLSQLPKDTNNQKINYEELQTKIIDLKNKISHIENIVPEKIMSLEINGEKLSTTKILIAQNELYLFGNGQTVATVNSQTKTIDKIINYEADITLADNDNNGNVIMITKDNRMVKFTPNGFQPIKTLDNQPISFKIYNSNLYLLTQSQIVKTNNLGTGASTIWLSAETDFSSFSDLTVDGSIYTLNQTGKLQKYYAGAPDTINSPSLDPTTNAANHIFTTPELNNLFLSDPANNRLIITDKQGSIIRQIIFSGIVTTTSIQVSPDGQSGYLIADGGIYKFTL